MVAYKILALIVVVVRTVYMGRIEYSVEYLYIVSCLGYGKLVAVVHPRYVRMNRVEYVHINADCRLLVQIDMVWSIVVCLEHYEASHSFTIILLS